MFCHWSLYLVALLVLINVQVFLKSTGTVWPNYGDFRVDAREGASNRAWGFKLTTCSGCSGRFRSIIPIESDLKHPGKRLLGSSAVVKTRVLCRNHTAPNFKECLEPTAPFFSTSAPSTPHMTQGNLHPWHCVFKLPKGQGRLNFTSGMVKHTRIHRQAHAFLGHVFDHV